MIRLCLHTTLHYPDSLGPLDQWFKVFHGNVLTAGGSVMTGARPEGRGSGPGQPDTTARGVSGGKDTAAGATGISGRGDTAVGAIGVPAVTGYTNGALFIEIIDKKQRFLIWEGVINRPVDVPMKDPDKHIPAAVGRLMGRFSPYPVAGMS